MNATLQKIVPQVTGFNLTLVGVGLLVLSIGLFRIFPIQFNRQFWVMNGILGGMAVVALCFIIPRNRPGIFLKGIEIAMISAGKFLPMMVLLVTVMSLGALITMLYLKEISVLLDKHPVLGWFVASLCSPTSNSLLPIVEKAWEMGKNRAMVLYYLQASALMSYPLYMLRQTGFQEGSVIPSRMYLEGLIVALVMLPLVRPIFAAVEWIVSALKLM
jgi:hypothetical protein